MGCSRGGAHSAAAAEFRIGLAGAALPITDCCGAGQPRAFPCRQVRRLPVPLSSQPPPLPALLTGCPCELFSCCRCQFVLLWQWVRLGGELPSEGGRGSEAGTEEQQQRSKQTGGARRGKGCNGQKGAHTMKELPRNGGLPRG